MTALLLPRLRADQYAIAVHPAKQKVVVAGRRYGKTVLGGTLALLTANAGAPVGWIVPEYKNGNPLWRWVEQVIAPLTSQGVRINNSDRVVRFPNGGLLGIYSADNADSIRSEAFQLVVLDEAARIRESAWYDAIQPTLADYDGDSLLISTPHGKNWFHREYLRGHEMSAAYASFHAPSSANPNPNIRKAFTLARDRVPERTFREEWLAEFVDDGGGVFRGIRDCATARRLADGERGRQYIIGVDLAKTTDFTVLTVIDPQASEVVHIDRFNQVDYTVQLNRLIALCTRFPVASVVIERNSAGEIFIEQAQRAGLPVYPFTTTNATKQTIIDALALAFEQRAIRIPDDDALIEELQAYETERLPSGMLRYSAPAGMHDDMVMSLAFAWHGAQRGIVAMPFRL